MSSTNDRLEALFAAGPVGFLDDRAGPSRLRRFICAADPSLPLDAPVLPVMEPLPLPEGAGEVYQGADAWKTEAGRLWAGLWTGQTATLGAVLGTPAPEQLVAFERAVQGTNRWSTFHEFRLDAELIASRPDEENLFEKCILNDQLNYLGTALPEAFSGLVCVGSLGNGDTYHLELVPPEGGAHAVLLFDHETAQLDSTFSVDLESSVYLAALCRAADEGLVSDECAQDGYRQLQHKVNPSWHFSMDERAPEFEPFEEPEGGSMVRFMFWRAAWIVRLLRHDMRGSVASSFIPEINQVLPDEHLPQRLETAARLAPTALYATWRAYLFGEPELEQYLEICRAHGARLVRDAARLIDELIAGRTTLGRIRDWPKVLAGFAALDLDPRRAEARVAEEDERAHQVEEDRVAVRAQLAGLDEEAELVFVAERLDRPELFGAILHTLLASPRRAKAKQGVAFLTATEYARDGMLYRHEEHDACRYVARHGDDALRLFCLAALVRGAEEVEEHEPLPSAQDLQWILASSPTLPEQAHAAIRDALGRVDLEQPTWRDKALVQLVGTLGVRDAAPMLRGILQSIPSEGGFETLLRFDEFGGQLAEALRLLEDADAAPLLLPMATSGSSRLRHMKVEALLTIAVTSPHTFGEALIESALELIGLINGSDENTKCLLALAQLEPRDPRVLEVQPKAKRAPEVQLALALARGDRDAAIATLEDVFTEPAYDQKGTIARRWLGLLACKCSDLEPDKELLQGACGLDQELDRELARLGGFTPPKWLSWFDAKAMDPAALKEALADSALRGRAHAARRLRGHAEARVALESVVDSLMSGALDTDARYLLTEAVHALAELPESERTTELFLRMLEHGDRDIKDPVLRHAPAWPGLARGMEFVVGEDWGWQAKVASGWLEINR